MKYYYTNILLQHETKLGFDFHILTRFIYRKEGAAHFILCWDVLYQILRGKEKCVVITTKETWGLFTYLTLWCFFFSYFCGGRTNGLTTWWQLGDIQNKQRLDRAGNYKPVDRVASLHSLYSVQCCRLCCQVITQIYLKSAGGDRYNWRPVNIVNCPVVREGMWRGGATTTAVWLIFLLGMFLVWKLWKINILHQYCRKWEKLLFL